MASKRDWLEVGLALLAEHGAPSVTIERLLEPLPKERLLGVVLNQAEAMLDEEDIEMLLLSL